LGVYKNQKTILAVAHSDSDAPVQRIDRIYRIQCNSTIYLCPILTAESIKTESSAMLSHFVVNLKNLINLIPYEYAELWRQYPNLPDETPGP
jgi:hypothetical protein